MNATDRSGTTRVIARHLAVLVLLGSLGCGLLPGAVAPPRAARAPPRRPTAGQRSPAGGERAAQPPPAATSAPVAADNDEALSESAYKDAVRPLMRRLRDNGGDSLALLDQAQGRASPGDAPDRAARLRDRSRRSRAS